MKQEGSNREPTDNRDRKALSKDYLGTGVAKSYQDKKAAIKQSADADDKRGQEIPAEVQRFLACIRRNHNAVTAFSTFGILLATAVYATFAILQWRAMGESNSINRQALTSVQRAFVYESPATIIRIDDPKTGRILGWSIALGWFNGGATPTRSMTSHVSARGDLTPLPDDFDFPDLWTENQPHVETPTYIPPKGNVGSYTTAINGEALEKIRHGTYFVNFWGRAKYRDILDDRKEHVSKFCMEIAPTPIAVDPKIAVPFELQSCHQPRSTCADEDCTP